MIKVAMSPAACALLRALIARSGVSRDRILLTDAHSADWHSLTFSGERHQIGLRISGSDGVSIAKRICDGIGEAEFILPGTIVADIGVLRQPEAALDGSAMFTIEALTIAAD